MKTMEQCGEREKASTKLTTKIIIHAAFIVAWPKQINCLTKAIALKAAVSSIPSNGQLVKWMNRHETFKLDHYCFDRRLKLNAVISNTL